MAGAATLTDWDWFTGMQTKFPVEIWHRNIKTDQGITCFFVPPGAHVAYVFVAHTSTQSSNKQRGAKSPLSSTWNEKSEPRARHEKKTHPQQSSTQKPGSCRQGQAAAGSWAAADRQTDRETDRQTGGMPTQTVSDAKPCFWWGARHTETKAWKPWNKARLRENKNTHNTIQRKAHCICCSTPSYNVLLRSPFPISLIPFQLCSLRLWRTELAGRCTNTLNCLYSWPSLNSVARDKFDF